MDSEFIECRMNCGACCIVPSISSPMPGMPNGKPAGVRCIHLDDELKCGIFESADRPRVCGGFKAETLICGTHRNDALRTLSQLEGISFDPDSF